MTMTSKTTQTKRFCCLNPRKKTKRLISDLFSQIGDVCWFNFGGLSLNYYPETKKRAIKAMLQSKKLPKTKRGKRFKTNFLCMQYNYFRVKFENSNFDAVIVWNGINGTRHVFSAAAKDTGLSTLHCELSPFRNTITVDPEGVNYANCLPRDIKPYEDWYSKVSGSDIIDRIKTTIVARQPSRGDKEVQGNLTLEQGNLTLEQPYIFVPLQVPGDSQLRVFGGRFKTVDKLIETLLAEAHLLPLGWHIRLKEHPSSKQEFESLYKGVCPANVVFDNFTDTFEQVKKSKAVFTVNSSVGLEAMFYEKPVVAMGLSFWAFGNLAETCRNSSELRRILKNPDNLHFSKSERVAYLSFLLRDYYVDIEEPKKQILQRLNGSKAFLFKSGLS